MKKDWLLVISIFLLIFILIYYWYDFPFILNERLNSKETPNASDLTTPFNWTRNGTFGDSYGALNALFGVFTIAGLLYTVYLQQTQLNLQRKELKIQRKELALQRDEMAATRNEFVMSRSTNIVYSQVERLDSAHSEFILRAHGEIYKGIEALQILLKLTPLKKVDLNSYNNSYFIRILIDNSNSLFIYSRILENSVNLLKGLFVNNNLSHGEIKELINIFYLNLGDFPVNVMRAITHQVSYSESLYENFPSYYPENYINETISLVKSANNILILNQDYCVVFFK